MGPITAKSADNLDKIIEEFDPDEVDFSPSPRPDPFRQLEQLQSKIDQIQHDIEVLSRIQKIDESDDGSGKATISSAITDYYEKTEWDSDGSKGGNVQNPSETDSWGYIQITAFSFVTASYLLDDYLERNNLQTAVNEAKRRSWIILLTLALMSHLR